MEKIEVEPKVFQTAKCSCCKTGEPQIKNSTTTHKDGSKTTQMYCRACARKRTRKYYANHKKSFREMVYKSMAKHKDHTNCRQKSHYLVKKGVLVKPSACSHCKNSRKHVQMHHPDYTKPEQVMWLCSGCHADQHKKEKQS